MQSLMMDLTLLWVVFEALTGLRGLYLEIQGRTDKSVCASRLLLLNSACFGPD